MDASRLLVLPVSTFFKVVASDLVKKLTVVINKPTPPSTVAPAAKPTAFVKMMNAQTQYKDFTSTFDVEYVMKFQRGYWEASNKET
mmetsp:Transcript_34753/g.62565  ORF Transcript_34753/g.62565 Transcript_34753/m.62565 type:complete len:86 (+) Transcript_34753:384-641(+)